MNHQTPAHQRDHLNVMDPEARKYLEQEMEKFLLGEGSEKPQGQVALVVVFYKKQFYS